MADIDRQVWWVLNRLYTMFSFILSNKKGVMTIDPKKPFDVGMADKDAPPHTVQMAILHKLDEWGAIHLEQIHSNDLIKKIARQPNEELEIESGWYIDIWPIQPKLDELYREYESKVAVKKPNPQYWITEDEDDYYFNGKKIFIKNKDADYVRIFDAVFDLIPFGGKVSYTKIIEQCRAGKLKTDAKKVQRALTGEAANFFRYVTDISWQHSGVQFFVAQKDGKTLVFNNKK